MMEKEAIAQAAHEVGRAVRQFSRQYQALLQNTVLRARLDAASLTRMQWREIEALLKHANEEERVDHDVAPLYEGARSVRALAGLLSDHIAPALKVERAQGDDGANGEPATLLSMTVANLDQNIELLKGRIEEIFQAAAQLDRALNGTASMALEAHFQDLDQETQ